MQELGVQGDAKRTAKTTPKLIFPAAVMANKRRAPVAILVHQAHRYHRVFQQQRPS